ncbi:methylglyoxal reductase (NADPH-dependent) gre2 [Exophiala oligosperma]
MFNSDASISVYDESSWNPITLDAAMADRAKAYRGSKTLAERAAWDFVQNEKPSFDLVTMCPPLVYGPVMHHLSSLESLNTSNQRIRDFIQGKFQDGLPPVVGSVLWTDVRDLALAHVKAAEVPEAGGRRFFITAGHYSSKRIVDAIRATHPELSSRLPASDTDGLPKDVYGYDNSQARQILGLTFRPLQESIGDTVTSLLKLGA